MHANDAQSVARPDGFRIAKKDRKMTTRNLPTDKNGNVYHGARTYAEACKMIDDGAKPAKMVDILRTAGFDGVADRVAKDYAGSIELDAIEASDAYNTGYEASTQGEPRTANPYATGTWDSNAWLKGWDAA
jgi:ribosome modulation factor